MQRNQNNMINICTIKELSALPDIVLSFLNGLDPKIIDPKLYDYIYGKLIREAHLYHKTNPSGYKCIQKALDFIDEYNESIKVKSKSVYQPSKDEISNAIQIVTNYGDISQIDRRMYPLITNKILELRRKAIVQKDHSNVKLYESAFHSFVNLSERQDTLSDNESQRENVKNKLENAINEYNKACESWVEELNDIHDTFAKGFKKMQEEDDRVIEEFDKHYDGAPPPRFTKFSSSVLNLRHQVELSSSIASPDELRYLQDQLKKAEEAESRSFIENWHKYLNDKRKNLIDEQNKRELSKINAYKNYVMKTEKLRDTELNHLQKLIKKYRMSIEKLNNTISETNNISSANTYGEQKLPTLRSSQNKKIRPTRLI